LDQKRTPSGIDGLDTLIQGGFPKGSLILLAGNPGTGKTVLASHFLYNGALKFGEKGLYVSFVEGRKTLIDNMLSYGLDFERLEREGKVKILDFLTMKEEGISYILEMILREISSLKAERLVIDSFTAMAQAFKEKIDSRIVLHTILSKMVRRAGCTTLLILEGERIESEVEGYVVDGLLILRKNAPLRVEERLIREIEISKMRGTRLEQPNYFFTLEGGFKVFPPFEQRPIKGKRRFEPIQDPEPYFSSGSEDLDKMLGGGYPKGGVAFLEIDEKVTASNWGLILYTVLANFLAKGRGGFLALPIGLSAESLLKTMNELYGFSYDEMYDLLRIFELELPQGAGERPCVVGVGGDDILEDYLKWIKVEDEMMKKTGQPVIQIVSYNSLETVYGAERANQISGINMVRTKNLNNLTIGMGCLTPDIARRIASVCDVYLRLARDHGTLLLYGVKPRTSLYVLDMDTSKGYPLPKLTPIT
jgi:circadian clock protein KaiC